MGDPREETEAAGERPWFEQQDETAARDLWATVIEHGESFWAQLLELLAQEFDGPRRGVFREDLAQLLQRFWRACRAWDLNDLGQLGPRLTECQNLLAERGVGIRAWTNVCLLLQNELTPRLVSAFAADPPRLAACLRLLQTYASRSQRALSEAHLAAQARLLAFERVQAEQAHARFKGLAESGIIGIIVCDFHGNIVEANESFLDKFGYSRADLVAGRVRWTDMTPPEWKHLDDEAVEQLRSTGKTPTWEKEYFHKNGSRIPILVGVAMLSETQTVAFILDIGERKRLEELRNRSLELESQNRRILEASRLKSEFVANMSHELRTPLNSILGFTELLRDGEVEPNSPQYVEFLEDILTSGRHLQRLIDDVLDLAKVEAGKIEFRPEEVEIAQLIGEVSTVLRTLAGHKRIRIVTHVAPEVSRATLDPNRFKQILYNYLSNALKFTPEGGTVEVWALPEPPARLRLVVEDTGIGIAGTDMARLFVEFQQLEAGATKTHAGTGLGLALTKRLVEAQGGTVGVKSVLGRGSQFHALLPLRAGSLGAAASALAEEDAPETGACVLVVEDDARDRELLIQTLTRAGYRVQWAATGAQAVACCAERLFDAITLDLLLPDMTGQDVLHRLRATGKNRETPVVVVSVVAEQGTLAGFHVQNFLPKPVDGRSLLEALARTAVTPLERRGPLRHPWKNPAL